MQSSFASYNTGGVKRRDVTAQEATSGPYDDQIAFTRDAGALAESLLSEGYAAMKIWPFDVYAEATGGHMISLEHLKADWSRSARSVRRLATGSR